MFRPLLFVILFGISLNLKAQAAAPSNNPVVEWNKLLLQLVRTPGVQPATVHSTRNFAMMHIAIFDSVNALDGRWQPYLTNSLGAIQPGSKEAAAVAAAHEVLLHLYPTSQTMLDSQFQSSLDLIPDGSDKTLGVELGLRIADQILLQRTNDGANATPPPYTFGELPGEFQSTPPNFPAQPQFLHWSKVTPFALGKADQFRPGSPPSLVSEDYAMAFNEVKTLGVTNSTASSADQALAGRFWNGAIQNYWNEIAQSVSLKRDLPIAESARLFALLNIAMADSAIAFYDAKYTYNFWRPITAVRDADADGNSLTAPDLEWLPEVGKTAPDPSYPGAHAVLSSVGAHVLQQFFGEDLAIDGVTSEVLAGVERSFAHLSDAADEASLSRIYAGQHFRFDLTAGKQLGSAVADFVGQNLLSATGQISLSGVRTSSQAISLSWTGGAAPFLVQSKTGLSETTWKDLTTTTNRSVTVSTGGTTGFFRISSQ